MSGVIQSFFFILGGSWCGKLQSCTCIITIIPVIISTLADIHWKSRYHLLLPLFLSLLFLLLFHFSLSVFSLPFWGEMTRCWGMLLPPTTILLNWWYWLLCHVLFTFLLCHSKSEQYSSDDLLSQGRVYHIPATSDSDMLHRMWS